MGEKGDEYSGHETKPRESFAQKTEEWPCPSGAVLSCYGIKGRFKESGILGSEKPLFSKCVGSVTSIFSKLGFGVVTSLDK